MQTVAPGIKLALDIKNHLGETPIWSEAEAVLYWINVEDPPELLRWNPKSGALKRWPMPERIGGIALKKNGGALVVLASGLFDFDLERDVLSKRVDSPLPSHVALHECACDQAGRLWVGSIDLRVGPENPSPGGATFFRLDGNELLPMIEGMSCANGLAFGPNGRSLYITDCLTGQCDRWDLGPEDGSISNRRTFFQLAPGEGVVDGACVDREGGYWATIVFGGALRRYLPDGTFDLEVKLPFENPTKVAFGGENLDTLYITSMGRAMGAQTISPLNGGLFSFKPGITGLHEPLLSA